jgi:hypothetical protein
MRKRSRLVARIAMASMGAVLVASAVRSYAQTLSNSSPICDASACTTFCKGSTAAFETLLVSFLDKPLPPPCTSNLPKDRELSPATSPLDTLQHMFDRYSWLTFIALNSPADGKTPLGKDAPTRWESWTELEDVMLQEQELARSAENQDRSFLEFGAPHRIPEECRSSILPNPTLILHMGEETFDQPFKSGPLVDQNHKFALNVILMNEVMFRYIKSNGLYSRAGQRHFDGDVFFTPGQDRDDNKNLKSEIGAMMVKASWKQPGENDDLKKFHTIDALLDIPGDSKTPSKCVKTKLLLVGLHIVHKTRDRNQWVWTTFEHVDNAPPRDDAGLSSNAHYSFFSLGSADPDCGVNRTPPMAWDMLSPPKDFTSQIKRVTALSDDVKQMNRIAQSLTGIHGTVWENYKLISTQWPADFTCAGDPTPEKEPDPTCAPAPVFLANSTLETYSQKDPNLGGVPQSTSSCIGCHNNATTHHNPARESDFTYILEKAH